MMSLPQCVIIIARVIIHNHMKQLTHRTSNGCDQWPVTYFPFRVANHWLWHTRLVVVHLVGFTTDQTVRVILEITINFTYLLSFVRDARFNLSKSKSQILWNFTRFRGQGQSSRSQTQYWKSSTYHGRIGDGVRGKRREGGILSPKIWGKYFRANHVRNLGILLTFFIHISSGKNVALQSWLSSYACIDSTYNSSAGVFWDIFTKFGSTTKVILVWNIKYDFWQNSRWRPGWGFHCLSAFYI